MTESIILTVENPFSLQVLKSFAVTVTEENVHHFADGYPNFPKFSQFSKFSKFVSEK
jgi:hypothetical protein